MSSRLGNDKTFPCSGRDRSPATWARSDGWRILSRVRESPTSGCPRGSRFPPTLTLVRGNVHLAAIHLNVAMTHKLARLTTRYAEAQAVHDVVQAALELLQKQFASDALGAGSLLEIIPELAFLGKVNTLGFLLLAKLQAVTYDFRLAVLAVLAGSKIALLDGTPLSLKHLVPLRNSQLHALAAAETTDGIGITCQVATPLDDRFTGLASPFIPDGKKQPFVFGRSSFGLVRVPSLRTTDDQGPTTSF